MIDIPTILTEFVKTARGPDYSPNLSVEPLSGFKSVYLERPDDVAKADYPFIVVDLTSIEKENGWLIHSYVNDNDNVVYETNYELIISYHVYGRGARAIANQLEGYLRFETVRNEIEKNTCGKVVTTLPIDSLPQQLSDKFVDSAVFSVLYAITDSSVDLQSGVIETLNLDGELSEGKDDQDPLPINIEIDYITP